MDVSSSEQNLRRVAGEQWMALEVLAPELLKLSVERASRTVLVEIMKTKQASVCVELLQIGLALVMLLDRIEAMRPKRMILGLIPAVRHTMRIEMNEEMLDVTFDERQRIAIGEQRELETNAFFFEVVDGRAIADCSKQS
jgi:hypothetical protein